MADVAWFAQNCPVLVLRILHLGSAEGLGCMNATHPCQAPTMWQLGARRHAGKAEVILALDLN